MKCRVCCSDTSEFAKAQILQKYSISYFCCIHCGFIQTESPYWLEEAYSDAINTSDVGLVSRNLRLAKSTKATISLFFDSDESFLDYGGGYGLFVRIMRDKGFNFFRYDPHCENLFAKSFDTQIGDDVSYSLVTAFEVFEHLVDPVIELEKILQFSKNVLFSTTLVPSNRPEPEEWWYYGLDHGQHVALYTRESLQALAEQFGLNLYTNKRNLHLFTEETLSPAFFQLVTHNRIAPLLDKVLHRSSLLRNDYNVALANMLK